MTKDEFWALIDSLEGEETRSRNASAAAVALKKRLLKLPAAEVFEFQKHFDHLQGQSYTYDLWGAAILVSGGYKSDDGFIDFRYGLISKGKAIYETVVADPDSLADLEWEERELSDQGFGHVAQDVYEELTGNRMPDYIAEVPFPDDLLGEPWDFNSRELLKQRFPRLWPSFQILLDKVQKLKEERAKRLFTLEEANSEMERYLRIEYGDGPIVIGCEEHELGWKFVYKWESPGSLPKFVIFERQGGEFRSAKG